MHPSSSPIPTEPAPGTESRSPQDAACAAVPRHPEGEGTRKDDPRADAGAVPQDLNLRCRVQRIERDLQCGRPVSDADLLQHSRDCSDLMHVCYGMFEAGQGDRYRDEADRWKNQAQHARNCLSPEWKAAREAQIQQEIASGTGCFFTDAADRDREAVNERGAG